MQEQKIQQQIQQQIRSTNKTLNIKKNITKYNIKYHKTLLVLSDSLTTIQYSRHYIVLSMIVYKSITLTVRPLDSETVWRLLSDINISQNNRYKLKIYHRLWLPLDFFCIIYSAPVFCFLRVAARGKSWFYNTPISSTKTGEKLR